MPEDYARITYVIIGVILACGVAICFGVLVVSLAAAGLLHFIQKQLDREEKACTQQSKPSSSSQQSPSSDAPSGEPLPGSFWP